MPPIISIIGKSGVGKTSLIEKLIPEIRARGYRVAVVKHHAHATPIDTPGKDSWRFAEAGADAVVVSSPGEVAAYRRVHQEQTLAEIASGLSNVDLVLAEGFKREPGVKIELSRADYSRELISKPEELLAVISDYETALAVRRLDLADIPGIAEFIIANLPGA